jgi:ADP-ribose pyrophosphatase YjhB (NUDIX family)
MATQQITYTEIDKIKILDTLSGTEHCTGHVYLILKHCGEPHVLLGHNAEHNNICSFGGFSDNGESLLNTILREHQEETLGCACSQEKLAVLLSYKSRMITRKSPKGQHYTAFTEVPEDFSDIDIDDSNMKLTEKLKNPDLTECEKENDYLVLVPLNTIRAALENHKPGQKLLVKDTKGVENEIRDINIPAYRWYFSQLDKEYNRKCLIETIAHLSAIEDAFSALSKITDQTILTGGIGIQMAMPLYEATTAAQKLLSAKDVYKIMLNSIDEISSMNGSELSTWCFDQVNKIHHDSDIQEIREYLQQHSEIMEEVD